MSVPHAEYLTHAGLLQHYPQGLPDLWGAGDLKGVLRTHSTPG